MAIMPERPGELNGNAPVLEVDRLSVAFRREGQDLRAVSDVSFSLSPGETVALVGESGSGKSVTSLALMRLIASHNVQIEGSIRLRGRDGKWEDLIGVSAREMAHIRGNRMSMVFQEPMTSLNPVYSVGQQVSEAIVRHLHLSRSAARTRTIELFDLVGIPEPQRRFDAYPHHLSGGMRQRVMIAMALSCDPAILIADEPTTALDVTVQAQILQLLKDLQARNGMSVLFITHNLGVVAEVADRVLVMYAGRVVESGSVASVLNNPQMPYTQGLLASIPRPKFEEAGRKPLKTIAGGVPDIASPPSGCPFHPRCAVSIPGTCDVELPRPIVVEENHAARCHLCRPATEEVGKNAK
ncbi:ABC transporter ATP-binding protein [Agrobacterium tumefaciens]|uniref:ABC transporter ATP-binding protein n=1 Tax=Agrobacterium tumefaciens TaxID=358 RepID=UPI003C6C5A57